MKKIIGLMISILMTVSLLGCQSLASETEGKTKELEEIVEQKNEIETTGEMKVYYLDVGQGDSIYINTPKGEDILIDGGDNHAGDEVVQFLRELKVDDIEVMVATHPDADHIGGLDIVLQNFEVETVYAPKVTHTTNTYKDFVLAVKQEGLKLKEVKAGVELGLPDIKATFVAPVKSYGEDLNDWSAVLRVEDENNHSFLFTGDASVLSEEDMINSNQNLKVDVLKVGHHGSDSSTGQNFLSKIQAKYAVISVGEGNRYNHPTDEVVNRLKQNQIKTYRTDKLGTILAVSSKEGIAFKNYKLNKLSSNGEDIGKGNIPVKENKVENKVEKKKETTTVSVEASVDNQNPDQYGTIHLNVTGLKGTTYKAVFHYKSKDTEYTGTIGTPLPVKIGRASVGFEVLIDVTVKADNKEYKTQTSFIPR